MAVINYVCCGILLYLACFNQLHFQFPVVVACCTGPGFQEMQRTPPLYQQHENNQGAAVGELKHLFVNNKAPKSRCPPVKMFGMSQLPDPLLT